MSLEDRFRQALEGAFAEARTRLDTEFTSVLNDVRTEAERDKTAALAALEEIKASELVEARTQVDAELRHAFQSEKDELASTHQALLSQTRESADGDAARLREEAEAAAARLRDESSQALEAVRAELQQVLADGARQREELEAALARAKQDASDAIDRAQLEAADQLVQARTDGESSLMRFREEHDGALDNARSEAQAAAAAHSQAVDSQLTNAIRLLESVRGLDGAASLTEVLDSLTMATAKEAGRAAILVVKGDRLIGWRTSGFAGLDDEPRSIESSTSDVGALAAAVNTGRPAVVGSGSVLAAPPFSQLPPDRPGLAVPLLVGGRPVAVLYADPGASAPLSPGWTSPVEVLVRHAGRCLEAIAVQRGAHAKVAAARVGTPA